MVVRGGVARHCSVGAKNELNVGICAHMGVSVLKIVPKCGWVVVLVFS
jgi:hypothetical protein